MQVGAGGGVSPVWKNWEDSVQCFPQQVAYPTTTAEVSAILYSRISYSNVPDGPVSFDSTGGLLGCRPPPRARGGARAQLQPLRVLRGPHALNLQDGQGP
jgi:hypothetical protein